MGAGYREEQIDSQVKKQITEQANDLIRELLEAADLKKGDILVIGCSSSEIGGGMIGSYSSMELAEAVFAGIYPELEKRGVYLAVQCCEHLNRALVLEETAARAYGYEEVCVIPQPKAGGSFATCAYRNFRHPVMVESVKAHAGMDIGDTLIGMHLRDVAVPVRLTGDKIGEAHVVCARTRPKYIGGSRAVYE